MTEYLKYFNIGLMLVVPALVGLIIGSLLDRTFGYYPVFTLVFLFLGIISGIWSLYKSIKTLV